MPKFKTQLAIAHGLSEDNLLFTHKLGSLVAPSLAIIRSDQPFKNFGGITLFMEKSELDLKKNPAFNADVFSPRFPQHFYQYQNEVLDQFSQFVTEMTPELDGISSRADYHDKSEHGQGFDNIVNYYMTDLRVMAAYAKTKGINPKIYRNTLTPNIGALTLVKEKTERYTKALLKIAKRFNSIEMSNNPDGEQIKEFSRALHSLMLESIKEKAQILSPDNVDAEIDYLSSMLLPSYFNTKHDEPIVHMSAIHKVYDFLQSYEKNPSPIDEYRIQKRLNKLIASKNQKEAFRDWLSEHIESAYHSPYFQKRTQSGTRKLPFDAQNALNLIKGNIQGGEQTIFMGTGSIRAIVAHKFRSFSEIQAHANMLCDKDVCDNNQDRMNDRLSDFPAKLAPFYKYKTDHFRYSDAVYEEIADYARSGRNLRAFESFDAIDREVIDELNTLLDDLKNSPTKYFEIKSQECLPLSKFSLAIVPKGTSKEAIGVLRENGIKVKMVDKNHDHEWLMALNNSPSILFGNLDTEFEVNTPTNQNEPAR